MLELRRGLWRLGRLQQRQTVLAWLSQLSRLSQLSQLFQLSRLARLFQLFQLARLARLSLQRQPFFYACGLSLALHGLVAGLLLTHNPEPSAGKPNQQPPGERGQPSVVETASRPRTPALAAVLYPRIKPATAARPSRPEQTGPTAQTQSEPKGASKASDAAKDSGASSANGPDNTDSTDSTERTDSTVIADSTTNANATRHARPITDWVLRTEQLAPEQLILLRLSLQINAQGQLQSFALGAGFSAASAQETAWLLQDLAQTVFLPALKNGQAIASRLEVEILIDRLALGPDCALECLMPSFSPASAQSSTTPARALAAGF